MPNVHAGAVGGREVCKLQALLQSGLHTREVEDALAVAIDVCQTEHECMTQHQSQGAAQQQQVRILLDCIAL